MNLSSADTTTIVIVGIFVLLIGRRIVLMIRGAPVRPAQMVAFAVLFAVLFVVALLGSFSVLPLWTYAVDAAVLVASTVGTAEYVRRHVVLDLRDGVWYYRLHIAIPVVYLVLFAARLALDSAVLGIDPFAPPPANAPMLSTNAIALVAVVDALFALSTGLLVGRTVGVLVAHRAKLRESSALSTPSGSR
ncbi:MAG: hypothetical protein L3K18_06050 [Thermoplasmata archaeon]|nr:hypothetical protein [Thermoplasmata archaeon]MCI4356686.1 hypothetical protein [Thermoplasmata archaeon]